MTFAAYQMPHPLVNELKVKIQTRQGARASDDAEYTPQRALHESINDLQGELTTMRQSFASELERVEGRGY